MFGGAKYFDRSHRANSSSLLFHREYAGIDHLVNRRLQTFAIDRLEQDAVLTGHDGCVNCLEWSSNGRMLASGSDDFQVLLWDPFRKRRMLSIRTKHIGNMFSVKFLPRHNDSLIATGAADKFIYVFDINRGNEAIFHCYCHAARVKRLATAPDSPYVFWSAGEDGTIMQLDMREQHHCRPQENRLPLINLTRYLDTSAEAKCLAINPRRTEFLAVGANDPYARIYDRRKLDPGTGNNGANGVLVNNENKEKDYVTYYCPGHINKNNSKVVEHESRAITYLTFNASGTELLVNMGGEHVYLYDLQSAEQPVFLNLPEYKPIDLEECFVMQEETSTSSSSENMIAPASTTPATPTTPTTDVNETTLSICATVPSSDSGIVNTETSTTITTVSTLTAAATATATATANKRKLPEHIEVYKKMGNDFLENEKYLRAIDQYSEAIALSPKCPVLYLNRATAYMRRLWFGDIYAALRDCHQALRLDPAYIKAHFRLARSLLELGRPQEADACLKELINRFPSYSNNHGVMMLHKDIKENRQTTQTQQQAIEGYSLVELSDDEFLRRSKAKDYTKRFVGHCNTTTDIKEANYFGFDGDFIVAGSDDGKFFLWERKSCKIRAVYRADGAIVNCVQPHPEICLMATSGIDHDVKIWSPIAISPNDRPNLISYVDKIVDDNQQKMKTDPFDLSTRNAFCWNG